MISNKIVPGHILKLYVWEVLSTNNIMKMVNERVPVIPLQDEAHFALTNQPYIIYAYSENRMETSAQERQGVFGMRIRANSFAELTTISHALSLTFSDESKVTESINIWTSAFQGADLIGIRFTHVAAAMIEEGDSPETEGGKYEMAVSITYRYISEQSVVLPSTGGLWS